MNKYIMFAFIAVTAVVCCLAKPGYYLPSSVIYSSPVSRSSAAAAAASSVAGPSYLYQIPSYVIDGGNPGYTVYRPNYDGSYHSYIYY